MMGTAIDDVRRPTPRFEGVSVSDDVEGVFLKALAVDPRDRYRDVGEFWDALEDAAALGRSAGAQTGFTPQPLRDPRSEGPPASREERLGVRESQAMSAMRAPGAGEVSSRKPDSKSSMKAAGPAFSSNEVVPMVPELDLELDLPPAPPPRRPESASKMKAVRDEPPPPSSQALPKAPPGPTQLEVAVAEAVPTKASGLDLAVPAELARRSSQVNLRAVNPQAMGDPGLTPSPPQAAGGVPRPGAANASGQYRALNATGKPPVVSTSPSPAPASRPLPAQPKPWHKLVVPISLIAVGLMITVAFYVNASGGGGRWAIGPVPINWIAGILVVVGTAMLMVRVFLREE